MFTGIITDVGEVRAVENAGDTHFTIATGYDTGAIAIGASIACSGPCLTVVETGDDWFHVTVSAETLARTTMADWRVGQRVNLERALKVGDELGGHIVSGHIDGIATVVDKRAEGESERFSIEAPEDLARYIASKGSLTLDGVSLTVNEVNGAVFGVNIIPHTAEHTTFGAFEPGTRINLEIDMLARYVARLADKE